MADVGQVKAATRSALKKMDVHFHSVKTEGEVDMGTNLVDFIYPFTCI
jgi:hypothetical protein